MAKRRRAKESLADENVKRATKRSASSTHAIEAHDDRDTLLHGDWREDEHTLSPFENLPVEILHAIMGELPFKSLLCMYFVSWRFCSIMPMACDLTKVELLRLQSEEPRKFGLEVADTNYIRGISLMWQAAFPPAFKLKELTCIECLEFVPAATDIPAGMHPWDGFSDEQFDRMCLMRSCIRCLQHSIPFDEDDEDDDHDLAEQVFHVGGEPWYLCRSHRYFFSSVRDAPSDADIRDSSTHYSMPSSGDLDPHKTCRECFREGVGMQRFEIENNLPNDTLIDKLTCCYCYELHGLSSDGQDGFPDEGMTPSNHDRRCIPCFKRYRRANRLLQEFYVRGKRYSACACSHWPEDDGTPTHTVLFRGTLGRPAHFSMEVDICDACYECLIQDTKPAHIDDASLNYKLIMKRHRLPDLWQQGGKYVVI